MLLPPAFCINFAKDKRHSGYGKTACFTLARPIAGKKL